MKYLKIQSKGQIEIEAFTLIGASSKKDDDTKIGYYGSGNKYAIASLLRNNQDVKVFSGTTEIEIDTVMKSFRGDPHEVIRFNGVETSFTTQLGGKDWDTVFAPIREIYSNALDEDENCRLQCVEIPLGETDTTTFFIEFTEDVAHFYDNVHLYFCNHDSNVLSTGQRGSIYKSAGDGIRIFRKGILAFHNDKAKSVFNYNSNNVDINESRIISSQWSAKRRVEEIVKRLSDPIQIKLLIQTLKGANAGYYEHGFSWDAYVNFHENWGTVCSEYKFVGVEHVNLGMFESGDIEGRVALPFEMLKQLKTAFPDDVDIYGVDKGSDKEDYIIIKEPTPILTSKVLDALNILWSTDYQYRLPKDVKIQYVHFTKESVLGLADNDTIYLSSKLDSMATHDVAKIIIEEQEHLTTKHDDETREFQNHLFNLYFEQLTRKPIY